MSWIFRDGVDLSKEVPAQHYVYRWWHSDVPRYVGKGTGRQWRSHLNATLDINPSKADYFIQYGGQMSCEIIRDGISEKAAHELEAEFIREHRLVDDGGTLLNMKRGSQAPHWIWKGKGVIRSIAAASFALLGITIPAHAEGPLLVIDRWWGVDYAKQHCQIPAFKPPGESEAACDQESTESYNVFELELKTQFAASAECTGITVSSFGYPQNSKEPGADLSLPHWNFSINYKGDEPAQFWQMLPPKGSKLPMMQATGTPSEIATQVCIIIKGKGGAVVH